MITIKSAKQVELMRKSCALTRELFEILEQHIKPGVNTKQLDKIAYDFYTSRGAKPNFLGYGGFPASACISINDEVIHGIPSAKRMLADGDIVKIDVGAYYKGYHGDTANTFPVGTVSAEAETLIRVTKESFFEGIKNIGTLTYFRIQLAHLSISAGIVSDRTVCICRKSDT